MLDSHILQPQDILVRKQLEELNLTKSGDGELTR